MFINSTRNVIKLSKKLFLISFVNFLSGSFVSYKENFYNIDPRMVGKSRYNVIKLFSFVTDDEA
jgi:hypothetical protein